MSRARYLLDVNVLIALFTEDHVHHRLAMEWFSTPDLQWGVCALTEGGWVRYATAPRPGQLSMMEATAILEDAAQHPGYRYVPIAADWPTLCSPFFARLYGTQQVTDAYLLGLAVREGLVLVTMDRGVAHLAGKEHSQHVLLLGPDERRKGGAKRSAVRSSRG